MYIFKQLHAHIQHNLCTHIQDNSYLRTFICTYSTIIMHIFKLFIQYMHIFKTIYICTHSRKFTRAPTQDNLYSRKFIYATKKLPDILFLFIQEVVLDLSSSEIQ